MELWEDEKQIEQAIKDKLWEKYSIKQLLVALKSYRNRVGTSYDKKFVKIMSHFGYIIKYDPKSSKKAKINLLNIAKNGKSRPRQGKRLGNQLCSYTSKLHDCYDALFDKQIRKLRPDWFICKENIQSNDKKVLLNLAKQKGEKPKTTTRLGWRLSKYLNPKDCLYDEIFKDKLIQVCSDWCEDKWFKKYNICKQFIKQNKKYPNQHSNTVNESTLGHWICNQKVKKKRPNTGQGVLTNEQTKLLEQLPNWKW